MYLTELQLEDNTRDLLYEHTIFLKETFYLTESEKSIIDSNLFKKINVSKISKNIGSAVYKSTKNKKAATETETLTKNVISKYFNKQSLEKNGPTKTINLALSEFKSGFSDIFDEENFEENIYKSIVLVGMVLIINSTIFPIAGPVITAVFVAPLTEETAKYIALKEGFKNEFSLVFNMCEFSLYVSSAPNFGISYTKAAIIRLAPVLMHLSTSQIQKYFRDSDLAKGMNSEDAGKTGYYIGIGIHALWNAAAIAASK